MRVSMIVLVAALPAAAIAQTSHHRDCGPDRQGHSSLGHDVGNVAVHQGSRVAGAAVAGPVGAAVAPVVTHHVGHAVKRVVKGKKSEQPDRQNCPRNAQSRQD
jgi:hypothetical protein